MNDVRSADGYFPFGHGAVGNGDNVCWLSRHAIGFGFGFGHRSRPHHLCAVVTGFGITVSSRTCHRRGGPERSYGYTPGKDRRDPCASGSPPKMTFDDPSNEEARCANTGLLHRSSIAVSGRIVGFRSDRRQTA